MRDQSGGGGHIIIGMEPRGVSSAPRDLPLHRRLVGGRYRLESVVGRGSMGIVYRARHVLTANLVALKCISPESRQRELVLARFRREVSISAHVVHDGIVKVYDGGEEEDGTLYLAMELLDGETLHQRALQPGFVASYGLNIVRALLEPLSAAHAQGIVHRDIKPENIFLHRRPDGRDQVKLLDFGIAQDPRHPTTTRTDVGIGTPFYMSPEQATNARAVSPASDVWSVGVLLYWLLAGELPFRSDTPFNTLSLVCGAPHRPIRVEGGPTTERLVALVDRTLSKEPADRPRDAAALLGALNEILEPLAPDESLSAVTYGSNPQLSAPWSPPLPAAQSSSGVVAAPATYAGAPLPSLLGVAGRGSWRRILGVVVSFAVVTGLGIGAGLYLTRAPVPVRAEVAPLPKRDGPVASPTAPAAPVRVRAEMPAPAEQARRRPKRAATGSGRQAAASPSTPRARSSDRRRRRSARSRTAAGSSPPRASKRSRLSSGSTRTRVAAPSVRTRIIAPSARTRVVRGPTDGRSDPRPSAPPPVAAGRGVAASNPSPSSPPAEPRDLAVAPSVASSSVAPQGPLAPPSVAASASPDRQRRPIPGATGKGRSSDRRQRAADRPKKKKANKKPVFLTF